MSNSTFMDIFYALWNQDFNVCSSFDNFVIIVYLFSFSVLFLENGVIIASFLPGDTLLIFIGILISKNVLNFPLTLGILTIAAALGSWFSYLQGCWLEGNDALKKHYFFYLPVRYQNFSYKIFRSYGLFALFISRFIVFVRTLCPIMIGLYGLNSVYFHFFNWMSAFFWIFTLTLLGFLIGRAECIQLYEKRIISYFVCFVIIILLIISIVKFINMILKKYK